ncbi:MAG TPA: hypothetical protein VFY93_02350 [Planctomycetota bacterium]|nr:hypothetical protein [Planctomycetota bacterium]
MTAREIALRSVSVVVLLLLAAPALAQEPADLTPLGIPDPNYACPFDGYYLVRYPGTPTDGTSFNLQLGAKPNPPPVPLPSRFNQTWGVPPEAKDEKAAGGATLAATNPAYLNGFWWIKLKGQGPGWVKLEVRKFGILVAVAFYRFYKIHILEDDAGDQNGYYKGFDPRYGAASVGMTFNECGGPYDRGKQDNDPPAEDIQGYDGRFQGGAAWTGNAADAGPLRPLPEAMVTGESLMFNQRNPQNIRIFLQGPREPFCPPVPVLLRCTEHGLGSIGTEIGGNFTPHDPLDLNTGLCTIPGSWDGPSRQMLVEQPPEGGGGNGEWMLRWAPQGSHESTYKGDIEIEAKIPNPSNLWTQYGAGATGVYEGVMHGRVGTVYKYADYAVWPSEPTDLDLLKTFWVRKVCHKFKNQPEVGTPDEATQAFGAKLTAGGRSETLRMETTDQLNDDPITMSPDEWFDDYMDEEVWVLKTNHKMAGTEDPSPAQGDDLTFYYFWTKADVPSDVAEPWSSNPDSVELKYRSYIGAVDVDVPGIIQFDAEAQEGSANKDVPQHFVNALADVNGDGIISDADDGDSAEEEASPGLTINHFHEADAQNPPLAASVGNLRQITAKLSHLPQGMTGGRGEYSLVITTDADPSGLFFWKDELAQDPISLLPLDTESPDGAKGWVVPLTAVSGDELSVYVGAAAMYVPNDGTFTLAIARNPNAQGHGTAYARVHIDRIRYSVSHFGITVDSDNNGTLDDADDMIELEQDHVLVTGAQSPAHIRGYKNWQSLQSPSAKILAVPGARVGMKHNGDVRLPLGPPGTADATYTWNSSTQNEVATDAFTLYSLEGWRDGPEDDGAVILSVSVAAGLKVVAYDMCSVRVVMLDMDLDNLADNDEENPGGFVALNCDNDNGSNAVANTNGWIPSTRDFSTHPIANEDDLQRITLTVQGADDLPGEFRLRVVNHGRDRIAIWDDAHKTNGLDLPKTWSSPASIPSQVWIEGVEHGVNTLREVELIFEYIEDPMLSGLARDTIRASVTPVVTDLTTTTTNPTIVSTQDAIQGGCEWTGTVDKRATNGQDRGRLEWVQNLTAFTMQLDYTAQSGRPSVTYGLANNPPLLDAGAAPPPKDRVFFQRASNRTNPDQDHEALADSDWPAAPIDAGSLPNAGDAQTLRSTYEFSLYLVWVDNGGTASDDSDDTLYVLGQVNWHITFHVTWANGVPSAGGDCATVADAATYSNTNPQVLDGPIANDAAINGSWSG